jgi:gliding motility-associated-like protein
MTFQRCRFCLFIFCWLLIYQGSLSAQLCTNPGQNPLTPFPVCGKGVFIQNTVPACNGLPIANKCGSGYRDFNPFYYQFTCYQAGKLCFTITAHVLTDDYDWQLFDITGKDPMLIYTDPTLIVSANWSGSGGVTGASLTAPNFNECGSDPKDNIPTFSRVPDLIPGHIYLLMVSHYTPGDQSGYDLNLSAPGGTAVITDPLMPAIQNATVACNNPQIGLKINKPIQCSSIASNGSDFVVSGPTPITIVSASGYKCSGEFETDSITLQFSGNLVAGEYTISTKNGTDGNGIIDFCLNTVNPATAFAIQFTPVAQILPLSTTSCSGTEFSITPVTGSGSSVPPDTYYTWSAPSGINFTGAQAQPLPTTSISGNLSVSESIAQTATYLVTPSGGGCTGEPFLLTVTVFPVPAVLPFSQTVCEGVDFSISVLSNTTGIIPAASEYNWSVPAMSTSISGGATGSNTSSLTGNLSSTSTFALTATYLVSAATANCSGNTFSVTVWVKPTALIQTTTLSICSGNSFGFTPTSQVPNRLPSATLYTWIAPSGINLIGGQAESTPSSSISGNLSVSGSIVQTATYLVTPSTGGCTGQPFSLSIRILPTSIISAVSLSICSGSLFSFSPANGTHGLVVPNSTYQYFPAPTTAVIAGALSGSGVSVQGELTNLTDTVQSVPYQVISVSGGCAGSPFTLTVAVFPVPAVLPFSQTVCEGVYFSISVLSNTTGIIPDASVYSWSVPATSSSISGGATGTNTSITGKLFSTATDALTATYLVMPATTNCSGNVFSVTVWVKPNALIQATTLSICSGNSFGFSPTSQVPNRLPSATFYSWIAPSGIGITGGGAATLVTNIQGEITNTTSSLKTATYSIIPITAGCSGDAFTVWVQVKPIASVQNISCSVCTQNLLAIEPTDGVNGIVPAETLFTWIEKDSTSTATGLPLVKISPIISTRFSNLAITASVSTLAVTPITGCGEGTAFSVVADVFPKATVPSLKDTICSGQVFQIILQNQANAAIPNATEFAWVSAVSSGWAGSLTGTSSNGIIQGNIRNLTGNINVLPLQVQPTSPGACLGNVFTLAFRVQLVANVAELSTTHCSGTTFWFTPVTGVNGSIPDSTSFTWQPVNTSAFVSGGLFSNDVNYFAGNFTSTASSPVALTYQVIPVTLRDGLACAGTPFTYTERINPVPTATIQSLGPSVICEGKEVNLLAAESGIYLWSNGSSLPAVSITSPQTVTLQVTNNYGCTTVSAPFNVTVHPRPRAKFELPDICLPDGRGTFVNRSTIADSTQLLFTFDWSFGDLNNQATSTVQNPTHRYSSLGTYPVQLIVYSDKGCVDTLVQLLQSIYPQPKVFLSATDIQLCLGQPIRFFATANGMGFAPRKWVWNMSDGGGTSLQNPVWYFQKPGMQMAQVYFVNEKGCASDTAAVSIPVYEKPKLKLPPTLTVNRGDSIRLVPTLVSGNRLYYKWYPSTYLSSDTAATPLSTPYNDITYQLQLTGEGYCMVSDTLHIKVMKMPEIPNAFSPNGDGIHDTWQIKYLQDYPNSSLEIFNRTGRLVYSSKGNGRAWDGTWEGKPVPVATYYYLIQLHNGQPPLSGSVTVIR